MPKTNGLIYVLVGKRDIFHLGHSIALVRRFQPALPITIWSDVELPDSISQLQGITIREFKRIPFDRREEHRNSDIWSLRALKESEYERSIYLDNDVYVVHKGFFEGFEIADSFGLCLPENPRGFVSTFEGNIGDLDIGDDVSSYDRDSLRLAPCYQTSCNIGLILYTRKSEKFIDVILEEMTSHPSRGQAALYRAIWKSKLFPYILARNWLVCDQDLGIKIPLALHVGHDRIYNWYRERFEGKIPS